MIRQLRLGLLALAVLPGVLTAQLDYAYTTFVHGFHDNGNRFLIPNTAGLLSNYLNVKRPLAPSLNGDLKIDDQAVNLFNYVSGYQTGPHVLVGHSMGGLTSRSAYFSHPGGTFAAIITMGTPHQGAPIADNAARASGYAINVVLDFVSTVVGILYRPTPGNILSSAAVAYIQHLVHDYFEAKLQAFLNAELGLQTDGLNDVKTTSPTVARLNSSTDPLPHANVLGTIGRRNAVFRVAFSALYNDNQFDSFVHTKNKVKSFVKLCRQIGWNMIIRSNLGRICNQADNAIGSIDDRWAEWTIGPAAKRDLNAKFDGLIPMARSRYPGETLTDPMKNFTAETVNHMNLQYNTGGIYQISRAMLQVGMEPPPPPPPPPENITSVSIDGSSQVEAGCTGSWLAYPYGGVAPYNYVWTAEGNSYDTGSDEYFNYTPSGSFTLGVTVTDSQGSTRSAYRSVSVVSGNCT
jgi:PGAP1-like protein